MLISRQRVNTARFRSEKVGAGKGAGVRGFASPSISRTTQSSSRALQGACGVRPPTSSKNSATQTPSSQTDRSPGTGTLSGIRASPRASFRCSSTEPGSGSGPSTIVKTLRPSESCNREATPGENRTRRARSGGRQCGFSPEMGRPRPPATKADVPIYDISDQSIYLLYLLHISP